MPCPGYTVLEQNQHFSRRMATDAVGAQAKTETATRCHPLQKIKDWKYVAAAASWELGVTRLTRRDQALRSRMKNCVNSRRYSPLLCAAIRARTCEVTPPAALYWCRRHWSIGFQSEPNYSTTKSWDAGSGFGRIRWRVGFGRIRADSGRCPLRRRIHGAQKFGQTRTILGDLDDLGRFGAILGLGLKLSPKRVPDSDGFGREWDSDGFGRIPEAQIWNAATKSEKVVHEKKKQRRFRACARHKGRRRRI